MYRPWAYITSVWSTDRVKQKKEAIKICKQLFTAGYTPICPILFLPEFINDEDPEEMKERVDISEEFLRRSRILVVCGTAIDEAVKRDIATAKKYHIASSSLTGVLSVEKKKK